MYVSAVSKILTDSCGTPRGVSSTIFSIFDLEDGLAAYPEAIHPAADSPIRFDIIRGRLEAEGVPARVHQEPAGVVLGLTVYRAAEHPAPGTAAHSGHATPAAVQGAPPA